MRYRSTLAALVLLAAPASTAAAQTDGYLLACSAAAQLGRGCVTLAAPHDPATLLANPASLAGNGARQLMVGGAAFLPTMDYTNAANPLTNGGNNVFPLPAAFFADHARGPVTLGVGVQTALFRASAWAGTTTNPWASRSFTAPNLGTRVSFFLSTST